VLGSIPFGQATALLTNITVVRENTLAYFTSRTIYYVAFVWGCT
jgi:hypothetical protein